MDTRPERTGILTSEFVAMLSGQIIALLVVSGKISPQDSQAWIQALSMMIGGALALGTGITFILSRSKLKQQMIKVDAKSNPPTEDAKAELLGI